MYSATFKLRVERDAVEAARALTGLSQTSFTRTVLLKESIAILNQAKEIANARAKLADDSEATPAAPISGAPDSGPLADTEAVHTEGV